MARLFTCGFEETSTAVATAMWTSLSGANTTIATTAGRVHSGTNAGRVNPAAAGGYFHRELAAAISIANTVSERTHYIRWYTYFETIPVATTELFRVRSGGAASNYFVHLLSTGKIRLGNFITSVNFDSATTFAADIMYRIEIRHLMADDPSGQIEIRVYTGDDTTAIETWGDGAFTGGDGVDADTLNTSVFNYYFGQNATTATADIYYDDVAINDATGTFQNSWCGPGKIALLVPNSDVAIKWESVTGGGPGAADSATFANVDGLDPVTGAVDDTDYNASDTLLDLADALGDVDRYGLTDLGSEVTSNATIVMADVYGRIGSNQTAATHLRYKIWDESGTLTNGPTVNANTATWRLTNTAEHLVLDTAGKTKANLDSFNVGIEPITDTLAVKPRRVSELWVEVEWLEATGVLTDAQKVPAFQFPGAMIGRRYV